MASNPISRTSSFDALETAIVSLDMEMRRNVSRISGWYSKLNELVHELHFWSYLATVLICIHKSSDAAEVVEVLGSLPTEIESAFYEITDDLNIASQKNYIPEDPAKLPDILLRSVERIQLHKQEIEVALDRLSRCFSLSIHSSSLDYFVWLHFIFCIQGILREIKKSACSFSERFPISIFKREVQSLHHFLRGVLCLGINLPEEGMINRFLNHITSVCVRIANQCFQYRINRSDLDTREYMRIQLQDLLHGIDPTTPVFLELSISSLRALNKIFQGSDEYFVDYFLFFLLAMKQSYLGEHFVAERRVTILKELRSKGKQFDIFMGLRCLAIFIINEPEDLGEDTQIILEEVKEVIVEAGPVFASNSYDPSSSLHTRVCFLKSQIFLKEQLKGSKIFEDGQVEAFSEFLMKLNPNDQSSAFIQEVAREVTFLYESFHANKITEAKARTSLFTLHSKILLFKVESCCMELLNFDALIPLGKDQIETLLEGLKWFAACVTNQHVENIDNVELMLKHIEAVATRVIGLHHSFLCNKLKPEVIQKTLISFSDLLDKIASVKPEFRKIYPQIQRSNFPKTDGLGFIDHLLGSIRVLLKHDPDSIALVKNQIKEIHSNFKFLRSFLGSNLEQNKGPLELKDLITQTADVAHEVEYVIGLVEVGIGADFKHVLWIYDLLEDIRRIKMEFTYAYKETICDFRVQNVTQVSGHISSQANKPEVNEEVVCLNDQKEDVVLRLTRGSLQRDVISIVGMPGIGKTTLANKIYNDPNIIYHFHKRVWCSVSEVYDKRRLLLDILRNIIELTDNVQQMSDDDLELKLYQNLKQKRYLIVLDDVWNAEAWSDLGNSLPQDRNGSRILMTSRLHDVALRVKPDSDPIDLRLLSEDESWKLLQMKILDWGSGEELQEIGKQIAAKCEGLPLAIVAIAGLLNKTERRKDQWEEIAKSLSSKINSDPQSRCKDILQLSYNQLPECLKACFLYMGACLQDKEIPAQKLIRLWIAEGFIQKTEMKSFEDLAEEYLMDLIGRSLAIISRKGSRGSIKTCRIHDLLRDLCLSKANEEKFSELVTSYNDPYASSLDSDYGANIYDYDSPNPVTYETNRLCFSLKRKHFVKSRPSGSFTHTLIFFPSSDTYPRHPYDISFITHNFKLLRVLYLEDINMGTNFPTEIDSLLQLRYLAVSGDIDCIPPSIANLWKLETLIVKGLKDDKVILPDTIWSMASLRHVNVNSRAFFRLQDDDQLGDFSQLENLVTFSCLYFSSEKDTELILKRLPNLLKLKCISLDLFPKLDVLIRLESLKVIYLGRAVPHVEFNLPWNLKKLTLSNFWLPWDDISAIGRLPNLEVLKLLFRAFRGQTWEMREGEFTKLKYLKLENLEIVQWMASSDHLPCLEQLVLQRCKKLEEVPSGFGDIPTLQILDVHWCSQSAAISAVHIQDEQRDMGNDELKVIISGMTSGPPS